MKTKQMTALERFLKLPTYLQDPYLRKANFLLSRNYVRDRSVDDIAAEIYCNEYPEKDPLADFVKGMIT